MHRLRDSAIFLSKEGENKIKAFQKRQHTHNFTDMSLIKAIFFLLVPFLFLSYCLNNISSGNKAGIEKGWKEKRYQVSRETRCFLEYFIHCNNSVSSKSVSQLLVTHKHFTKLSACYLISQKYKIFSDQTCPRKANTQA